MQDSIEIHDDFFRQDAKAIKTIVEAHNSACVMISVLCEKVGIEVKE